MNPPASEIIRFRELARAYGSPGHSWWSWQSSGPRALSGLTLPLGAVAGTLPAPPQHPTLRRGARGDVVRLGQRLLGIRQTGFFGAETKRAVRSFQGVSGLAKTGALDPSTWAALTSGP
jgi:peptidoglycan hydrolase-like protein with peptidoglycan-binding domain